MFRIILKHSIAPVLTSIAVFLLLQLQVFNLGIGFRDEGFLLINSQRILNGDIPYKDFFLTTTPGSFYLQAFISSLTNNALITSRVIYITFVVLLLLITNLTYVTKSVTYKYIVLISLALMFVGPAAIGFYNIEGLVFALSSYLLLARGLSKSQVQLVLLSGVMLGVAFLFKQSFGILFGIGLLFVFLSRIGITKLVKDRSFRFFILGGLIVIIPFLIYFILQNAFDELMYHLVVFASIAKSHRTPFIIKSVLAIPIMYIVFRIFPFDRAISLVKKNWQYIIGAILVIGIIFPFINVSYFEISRLYYGLFLILPIYVYAQAAKSQVFIKDMAILLLFFFLSNASSGREIGVVKYLAPFFFPLIIEYISAFNAKNKYVSDKLTKVALCAIIGIQVILLSWGSIFPEKVYSYPIEDIRHEINLKNVNGIKVSNELKKEIEQVNTFVNRDEFNKTKLICFPYCPLMNVLTSKDSPSFYNLFYHETFLSNKQEVVIRELESKNVIVVVQKIGIIEKEAAYEDNRLNLLVEYISKSYNKKMETENFVIYSK